MLCVCCVYVVCMLCILCVCCMYVVCMLCMCIIHIKTSNKELDNVDLKINWLVTREMSLVVQTDHVHASNHCNTVKFNHLLPE